MPEFSQEAMQEFISRVRGKRITWYGWSSGEYFIPDGQFDGKMFSGIDQSGTSRKYSAHEYDTMFLDCKAWLFVNPSDDTYKPEKQPAKILLSSFKFRTKEKYTDKNITNEMRELLTKHYYSEIYALNKIKIPKKLEAEITRRKEAIKTRRQRIKQMLETAKVYKLSCKRHGVKFLSEETQEKYPNKLEAVKILKKNIVQKIREHRIKLKEFKKTDVATKYGFHYFRIGGLCEIPISKMMLEKMENFYIQQMCEMKKPKTLDKHVGIELEFLSDLNQTDLLKKLVKEGKELKDYIEVKSDGSLRSIDSTFKHSTEIAFISPFETYKPLLKKLLDILNKHGKVNSSCGMHVHHDARQLSGVKAVHAAKNLVDAQPLLFKLQPKSRRPCRSETIDCGSCSKRSTCGHRWCQKYDMKLDDIKTKDNIRLPSTSRCDYRYFAINFHAIRSHGSYEVRCHSGTLDYSKISSWVDFTRAIMDCEVPMRERMHFSELLLEKRLKLPRETAIYIQQRAKEMETDGIVAIPSFVDNTTMPVEMPF